MRLAVFSDIHSNEQALSACLAYADHVGVDGYVFLGDHLTDCPYPRRTLDVMREAGRRAPAWYLRGNREDYLIRHHDGKSPQWKPSSTYGSLLYTYENITEDDIAFLRNMPISDVISLPGCPDLAIAHATPENNNVLLYPGGEPLEAVLRKLKQDTLLSGHSHIQFRYESRGRQIVNPGSVGLPTHGQPKAQFALVTCLAGRWSARLMNVDYDRDAELRQFEESGLSDMAGIWALATRRVLQKGGMWQTDCLQVAKKLAGGEEDIPEVCWEEAARRIGLM